MPQRPAAQTRTARRIALCAALGSALLLIGAYGFQAAGYRPCELCLLQRWPHVAAALLGAVVLVAGYRRAIVALGLAAAIAAFGLALFHTGVELEWWPGPAACTGGLGDLAGASTADLMSRLRGAQVVRCDQPAWSLMGISMAGWNALISAALSLVWAAALRAPRR